MENTYSRVLGLIPARGGSKSIPLKNMAPLNGYPLISYVINAGKKCNSIQKIICSTDDPNIAKFCTDYDIDVIKRSKKLAQDNTPVIDVIISAVKKLEKNAGVIPWAVALLQPTSPFVLPDHIDSCVALLKAKQHANSIQTITQFPHNYHAFNQRIVKDGIVNFKFREERTRCYNKQKKPKFYIFGNLIITKTQALLKDKNVFAKPSLAYEIPTSYALGVDGPEDLELAEWYLAQGKVVLPKM